MPLDFMPVFAEIVKIDQEQRMVMGYASTEKRDQQGEVIRLEAIKAALPEYMQFANIREMHQPSAVGIAKEAQVDDKGLWLGAKVVDDRAWEKVKAGVYKGFSIGGRVTRRDAGDKSVITGLELTEISLVDRPANPDAVYTVVKRANGSELIPQPVQKWDCGDNAHQHLTKDDAATCIAYQIEKAAKPELRKAMELKDIFPELGPFPSHKEAALYYDAQADRQDELAARAKAFNPRIPALVRSFEAAAAEHSRLSTHYRTLAKRHRDVNAIIEEYSKMPNRKLSDVEKEATDAVNALGVALYGDEVTKKATDHKADAQASHKMALEYDAAAVDHLAKAVKSTDQPERTALALAADNYIDIADSYLEMTAYHLDMAKALDMKPEDHAERAKLVKEIGDAVVTKAKATDEEGDKENKDADEQEKAAKTEKDPKKAEEMGKAVTARRSRATALKKRAERLNAIAKAMGVIQQYHDMAGKPTSDVHGIKELTNNNDPAPNRVPGVSELSFKMAGRNGQAGNTTVSWKLPEQALKTVTLSYVDEGGEVIKALTFAGAAVGHTLDLGPGNWLFEVVGKLADGKETEVTKGNFRLLDHDPIWKKTFTDKQRENLASEGKAMPDGSFPIEGKQDLRNAVQAYGRAKDKAKAKAHIIARAKALGATDELPDDWKKMAAAEAKKAGDAELGGEGSGKNPDVKTGDTIDTGGDGTVKGGDATLGGQGSGGNAKETTGDDLHTEGDGTVKRDMKCPDCGTINKADAKECAKCGADMQKSRKAAKVAALGGGTEGLTKGMYIVARLAEMVAQVEQLRRDSAYEQIMEGDDDDETPSKLDNLCSELASTLRDICASELEELLQDEDVEVIAAGVDTMITASANPFAWPDHVANLLRDTALGKSVQPEKRRSRKALADAFAKVGARHNANDKNRIQKIHDHTVDLGAECGGMGKTTTEVAAKFATITADRDAALTSYEKLTKQLVPMARDAQANRKELALVKAELAETKKLLNEVAKQPLDGKGKGPFASIAKGQDIGDGSPKANAVLDRISQAAPGHERQIAILRQAHFVPGGTVKR